MSTACYRNEHSESQYAASRRHQQQPQPSIISQTRPESVIVPIHDVSMLRCYNCKMWFIHSSHANFDRDF